MSLSSERPQRILLAVTGGVAAFKGVLLLRELQRSGFDVRVLATESALRFVGEPTWHALSRAPVAHDLWSPGAGAGELHVELARDADAMVIYPATTRVVGSLAAGITDDLVTLTASCMNGPVVVCPAMHTAMANWEPHRAAKASLVAAGLRVVEPVSGPLASGETGFGRLPEPSQALEALARALAPQDLAGKRVLVSAGPTREHVDPVRFLSNPSTGRMGFAVARAAARRGAHVTLVAGPVSLPTPDGVHRVDVESAQEMRDALGAEFTTTDLLVMTAAVADFRPASITTHKLRKSEVGETPSLALERTDDILAGLSAVATGQVLVGFAMETSNLAESARGKLERKGLDLVVANHLHTAGAGFGTETNVVVLVSKDSTDELPLLSKDAVAERILDRVGPLVHERSQEP
ncbi:MAG: bifunctional phosphopantothenoylcysteine decarboxylase/phosphopantothenate--cysteine ligase CoaBC [Deltaproteobacteria bacterium]|nr:bifunctional phosphopantothenoylcysteine decarboxylase/phosphopantothenate--cysteine ligase CoaBC [Deltaproteobacteria bacterium]